MIEGVIHHCTEMEVDRQYVDSHGQSTVAFAFCRLLGFQLLPRLKAIHSQKLYRPETGKADAYANLQQILTRPIDWELVRQQYDQMIKYATALRLGTAETDEFDLQKLGDAAIGLTTAFHYSGAHDSPTNKQFVDALKKQDPSAVANYASVGAWDGMHVIHKMIEATGGQRDGEKAMAAIKGHKWESPRGPVSIDVGLAGTVMRFVPPLASLATGRVDFDGDPRARDPEPLQARVGDRDRVADGGAGDRLRDHAQVGRNQWQIRCLDLADVERQQFFGYRHDFFRAV